MTYLSKILPLLVLPVGVTLLLLAVGIVTKRRRFVVAGAALLFICSLPITGDTLYHLVERGYMRVPIQGVAAADAIVVLSTGRVMAPGVPPVSEWVDADRYFAGVALLRADKAPVIVFTGGWSPFDGDSPLEGDVLRDTAIESGVPADRVVTTGRAFNTAEEGTAVADVLRSRFSGSPRVILVTSAFHMPRAHRIFTDAGFTVTPFPVDFRGRGPIGVMDFVPTASAIQSCQVALRELYGRVYYGVKPF